MHHFENAVVCGQVVKNKTSVFIKRIQIKNVRSTALHSPTQLYYGAIVQCSSLITVACMHSCRRLSGLIFFSKRGKEAGVLGNPQ